MRDIESLDDIKLLVDSFYGRVQQDARIGPIFHDVVKHWQTHLDKIYRFWQTILLHEHTYSGSPFLPHAKLPVDKAHFDRWIQLFSETMDELFEGEKAKEAKWRAEKMAEMFLFKINYFREHPNEKPL